MPKASKGKGRRKPDKPPDKQWGKYVKPSSSIKPGGHPGLTAPTEDPRIDSGLHPQKDDDHG